MRVRRERARVATTAFASYVPQMTDSDFSRRGFLGALAGASALSLAGAAWNDARGAATWAARVDQQEKWQVLKPEQVRELDAVTAQFVPTDETPGAREAHVVRFIDRSLATYAKDQQPRIEASLKKLGELVASHFPGATSFASLGDAEQVTVLKDWQATDGPTFFPLLGATMTGMFCNPQYGGNFNKVGWKLLGFKDQFSWVPPFGYYDRV